MENNVKINGITVSQFQMNNLLEKYNFTNNEQYFETIVDSVINGQRTQAKNQFKAMRTEHRKTFVKYIYSELEVLSQSDKEMFVNNI